MTYLKNRQIPYKSVRGPWSSIRLIRGKLAVIYEICSRHEKPRNEARSQCQGKNDPKWYAPLRHPKMNQRTKFGIPTSNNIGYALDIIILETRSEFKVKVTQKWYLTLPHQKLHPQTKFGIPTCNNISAIQRTRFF